MATIDELIKNQKEATALILLNFFLDDYFTLFQGSTKDFHALLVKMNNIHPTIKFTISHKSIRNEPKEEKCSCEEIYAFPFLDVSYHHNAIPNKQPRQFHFH